MNELDLKKLRICGRIANEKADELFDRAISILPEENTIPNKQIDFVLRSCWNPRIYHAAQVAVQEGFLQVIKVNPNRVYGNDFIETNKIVEMVITTKPIEPLKISGNSDFDELNVPNIFTLENRTGIIYSPNGNLRALRCTEGNYLDSPLLLDGSIKESLCGVWYYGENEEPSVVLTTPKYILKDGKKLYKYITKGDHGEGRPAIRYYLSEKEPFKEWDKHTWYKDFEQFEIHETEYYKILSPYLKPGERIGIIPEKQEIQYVEQIIPVKEEKERISFMNKIRRLLTYSKTKCQNNDHITHE